MLADLSLNTKMPYAVVELLEVPGVMEFSKLTHMKNTTDVAFHLLFFLRISCLVDSKSPSFPVPGEDLLGCSYKAYVVSRAGFICHCHRAQCGSAHTLFSARPEHNTAP